MDMEGELDRITEILKLLTDRYENMQIQIDVLKRPVREKCSCQKREDDINEMFSEWNGE